MTMVDHSAPASSHLTSLLVLFYAPPELLPCCTHSMRNGMITTVCGLMLLGLLGLGWLAWTWWRRRPPQAAITAKMQRLLRPRTPDDWLPCRQQATRATRAPRPYPPVRPWHEVKRRRGKPKRIATAGFACPAPTCPYYRSTDPRVHALVGNGTHGTTERIQTLRCQAGGGTFSARRDTPLAPPQDVITTDCRSANGALGRPRCCRSWARVWP